jgi:MATE family multidrug resistance protein
VSLLTFCLAWPIMVIPTGVSVWWDASLYWPWAFATAHLCAMALCFWLRFRSGKWKTMRVIESAPLEPDGDDTAAAPPAA